MLVFVAVPHIISTINCLFRQSSMILTSQLIWDHTPKWTWTYLIIGASIVALYALRSYIKTVRFALSLNGPPTVPFFGNVKLIINNKMIEQMSYAGQYYGVVFRIWVACLPYVVLLEPEDIQAVLGSTKHTQKIFLYKLLDTFIGKGLITKDVSSWRFHRKTLQPAFHVHALEKFANTFAECADRLANKLLEMNGTDVNVTSFVNDIVYDILRETVLGISPDSQHSKNSTDNMPFRKGQVFVPHRLVKPWLLLNWIFCLTKSGKMEEKQRRYLYDTCFKMLKEKRDFIRNKNTDDNEAEATKKGCLLEYMIEINEKNPLFSDEDIVQECCTFMLAGQESVSTATAMTIFLLANHPEWQEKCINEIDSILDEDSGLPTMNDLKKMRCLEMCIKEALRLYPSVPIFARVLGEDLKLGNRVIPAGCGIFMSAYSTHRLPHHFPDPNAFNPERFNAENSQKRHPYAYLPFSAGPRNCIGYKFAILEIKAMISAILRKCRLQSVPGKDEMHPKYRITIRAQGGVWVKVVTRDKFT